MTAWMRSILTLAVAIIFLLFPTAGNAEPITPELNAQFRPGGDGQSVTLSSSVALPSAHGTIGTSPNVSPYVARPVLWQENVYSSFLSPPKIGHQVIDIFMTNRCDTSTFNTTKRTQIDGDGYVYYGYMRDRTTGEQVSEIRVYCKPIFALTNRPPEGIVLPPTYGDIWNSIYGDNFDDVSVNMGAYVAPSSPGLTQLPTHIWTQFPGGQEISRVVNFDGGYQLHATARISEVSIFAKTPKGTSKSIVHAYPDPSGRILGGSFEHPLAVYQFASKGLYTITTGIVWTADNVTLSGPDIGTISIALGDVRLQINREYEVEEIRPGLTG